MNRNGLSNEERRNLERIANALDPNAGGSSLYLTSKGFFKFLKFLFPAALICFIYVSILELLRFLDVPSFTELLERLRAFLPFIT